MNPRIILALTAAACLAVWLLAGGKESEAPAPPAAIAPPAQTATIGQAGWFSALQQPAWLPATGGSGTPVYGRNGRAIDLGGMSVAQYIASRVAAARSGDAKAAYEVYQAESVCAANEDPVAEYHDPAEKEKFLRERAGLVKLCVGLSPAQVQERLGFLATAARAGHLGAQVDFYMEGPYGREFNMLENGADPAVKQWKEDAVGYLKQAGNKCDHFALALLSTVYDAGQLAERDMRTSMAYSIAAAVPRKKPMSEEQLRARFGDEMSAEDFNRARLLGEQLTQQACPKG